MDDGLEGGTVGEGEGTTAGIDEEFLGQGAGDEILVLEDDFAELLEGLEARAVFEGAVLFDVGAFGVGFTFGDFFALAEGAIPRPFATDGVEYLESEAGGIDVVVTAGARFFRAVFRELIADGDRATDVGFDSRDARRWRGDGLGEDLIEKPDATEDGGGVGAIGGDFEYAGLGEEAAANGVVRNLYDA